MIRRVQGYSMMPVLPPNTLVLGLKYFRALRINDVIIFYHDGREKMKRIQTIENGNLFVIGDHADASTDSRHFGWISTSTVIAKVVRPRRLQQEFVTS
jgi:nickel-type superoxide dismutase maturation protease